MPKTAYLTCLWPGLARLWWMGDWKSLGVALSFAALFNLAAFYSVFPAPSVAPHWLFAGWVVVISWWGASIHSAWVELPMLVGVSTALSSAAELAHAQTAYLKRDFVATEGMIGKVLKNQPGDPAVRLLLASTFRQTGRIPEARALLSSLQSDPAAFTWQFEIQADLARLDRQEKATGEGASAAPVVESEPRVVKATTVVESAMVARRTPTRRAA
jgi:hypothetical protein